MYQGDIPSRGASYGKIAQFTSINLALIALLRNVAVKQQIRLSERDFP